jgi:hypothetical protein
MKTYLKIGFFILTMIFAGNLAAQEAARTDGNLVQYYDSQLFQWSYSMFGGLSLNFQGQNSVTGFGIKDSMKSALIQYEDANRQYRSYRGKTIAGNILVWGGLAAMVAGSYVPLFMSWQDLNAIEGNLKLSSGLLWGGLASWVIGIFTVQSGQENIFNAVNLYNRQRIAGYR